MSKTQNNNDNDQLRQLLQKANNGSLPDDDFEREALEGFAMLQNKEEALELKAALDAQAGAALFNAKKPQNNRNYWMAAAALLIAIGFTVYFVQKDSVATSKDLAENTLKYPQKNSLPTSSNQLQESLDQNNEDASKVSLKQKSAAGMLEEKSATVFKSNNNQKQLKTSKTQNMGDADEDETLQIGEAAAAPVADVPVVTANTVPMVVNEPEEKEAEANIRQANEQEYKVPAPAKVKNESKKKQEVLAVTETLAKEKAPSAFRQKKLVKCNYTNGAQGFEKDLQSLVPEFEIAKLKLKGLVMLSGNKEVLNIEYINTGGLSKGDLEKITSAIKKLKGFVFENDGKTETWQYEFETGK